MTVKIKTQNTYETFSKKVDPYIFILGILIGFGLCCFLGIKVQSLDVFGPKFIRPHGPETYFYPPLSFLISHVEHTLEHNEQIVVIVGGSSVMFGTSQKSNDVWTVHLQRELGKNFKVYNFALRAGAPQDIASQAAETLLKRGYKVIYVTDVSPYFVDIPLGTHSAYSFWFAYFKKWLFNSEERLLHINHFFLSKNQKSQLIEFKLRGFLNTFVSSDELWSYVGYTSFFSSWTPYNQNKKPYLWSPISEIRDEEGHQKHQDASTRFEKYFVLETEVDRLKTIAMIACPNGTTPNDESFKMNNEQALKALNRTFPKELRDITHFSLNHEARYYYDHLSPQLQKCYNYTWNLSAKAFKNSGITSTEFMENTDYEDNNDRTHLLANGGKKLAIKMAPDLKIKAKMLYGIQ